MNVTSHILNRRTVLTAAPLGAVAVVSSAHAQTPPTDKSENNRTSGYRLTAHVKTAYDRMRF